LNPEYWGKTAAGVLPLCVKTGRVLLTLRSQEVMEPGTWGIPGGRVMDGGWRRHRETGELFREPVERPEDGALREFREETFYTGKVQLVRLFTFRDRLQGFGFHNFLGLVRQEFSEERVEEGWETEVARWMSVQEALAIEPKHFGLRALLADEVSQEIIMSYAIIGMFKQP
jgi:ADP-ribose pyrophosphatase YjhB (NUDIX family)